jgi:ABC-type arginine/histidine transport system permease subunit
MNPRFDPSSAIQQLAGIPVALWLVIFAVFILWFISLIDILRNEFKKDINKLVWFFTITIPVLGPMLYFFIGFIKK